jgi:hypothetical protein
MIFPLVLVVSCLTPASELSSTASPSLNLTIQPSTSGSAFINVTDGSATTASPSTSWITSSTPTSISVNITTAPNATESPSDLYKDNPNPYPAYSMPPTPAVSATPIVSEEPSKVFPTESASSASLSWEARSFILQVFFLCCFFVFS